MCSSKQLLLLKNHLERLSRKSNNGRNNILCENSARQMQEKKVQEKYNRNTKKKQLDAQIQTQ